MRARLALALLVAVAFGIAPAHAQRASERYIPIGRSPGLSGVSTLLGTVESVDARSGRLVVRAATGLQPVQTDDATRIWLDRSAQGRSSVPAGLADCREGLTVEVAQDAGARAAAWIKIRAPTQP